MRLSPQPDFYAALIPLLAILALLSPLLIQCVATATTLALSLKQLQQ